jgi:hypothetical protein
MVGLSVMLILLVGLGGGLAAVAWLAWPWVKRNPRRSAALAAALLVLATLWVLAVRGSGGRHVRVVNDADEAYTITLTQGGREMPLGRLEPHTGRRLRLHPEAGFVQVRCRPERDGGAESTLGFSLDGPILIPAGATVRVEKGGAFSVAVGPAVLGF